jgi:hypothetical protein
MVRGAVKSHSPVNQSPVGASYNMSIDNDKDGASKSRTARRHSFQERGIQ